MAAGGMSHRDDAFRVQIILTRRYKQLVGSLRSIHERSGVTAARPVDPAIVDVPHCHARSAQVVGDPVHQRAIGNLRLPAAAVHHDDHWVRPGPARQPHVDLLHGILAVADGRVGCRARALGQIGPGERHERRSRFRHGEWAFGNGGGSDRGGDHGGGAEDTKRVHAACCATRRGCRHRPSARYVRRMRDTAS
jgi:hypothetical protein